VSFESESVSVSLSVSVSASWNASLSAQRKLHASTAVDVSQRCLNRLPVVIGDNWCECVIDKANNAQKNVVEN